MTGRHRPTSNAAPSVIAAAIAGAVVSGAVVLACDSWYLLAPQHGSSPAAVRPLQQVVPDIPKTAEPARASTTPPPAPPATTAVAAAAAPIVDSPAAQHICAEVQASHLTPDQYRRYIQTRPSYAWMTDEDKADFAAGLRMASTGSCY